MRLENAAIRTYLKGLDAKTARYAAYLALFLQADTATSSVLETYKEGLKLFLEEFAEDDKQDYTSWQVTLSGSK